MGLFDLYSELPLPWSRQEDFAHDLAKERKGCMEESHQSNSKEKSWTPWCGTTDGAHCKGQSEGRFYFEHIWMMSCFDTIDHTCPIFIEQVPHDMQAEPKKPAASKSKPSSRRSRKWAVLTYCRKLMMPSHIWGVCVCVHYMACYRRLSKSTQLAAGSQGFSFQKKQPVSSVLNSSCVK